MSGRLKPGDRLPPIRKLTEQWACTPGTVSRAYQVLAQQGLVESRVGQGTRVIGNPSIQEMTPLRRAMLFNRIESYLLEIMTAGYSPDEVEQSVRMALEHWRTFTELPQSEEACSLKFAGSHDPAVAWIASQFQQITDGYNLHLTFSGSLGGLIALSQNKADLAGSHLWDEETDTYNLPFVRRLMPGKKVALITLAQRKIGLLLPPGNPLGLRDLADLSRPGLRFTNRQPGSGTRVWLDAHLKRLGINPGPISGYQDEKLTHSEVALSVAQGHSDTGLGVQTAALLFGLDFIPLNTERYDLVIPAEKWNHPAIQALTDWLNTPQVKNAIEELGGYEITQTGQVEWLE